MSTPPPRIFVSHSHKDDEFCIRLVEDLRRAFPEQDTVWYDSHGGLLGGDTWWKTIIREITSRTIFLVVLSPDAIESSWVDDEINLAWMEKNSPRRMQFIPLLRHACTIRADLRSLQIIDFQPSRDYRLAFDELLAATGGTKPQPAHHQPTSHPHQQLLTRLMPQIESSFKAQDWPDVLRKADYLLKHAIEDIPATLYLLYGIASQRRGQAEQAQGAFEMALVIVNDREQRLTILQSYTDLLTTQERWDDILPLATEALELLPNDASWSHIKQQAQGQGKDADEWLKEAGRLYGLKRYEEALAAYEQAIKLDPNSAIAYHNKGLVLNNLKRYEEAIAAYEEAIKLKSNYAKAYYNKGVALGNLNRHEEALATFEQKIKLDPNDALAYYNKGLAFGNLKRYEEALVAFDQAIKLDPSYAHAYHNKGVALKNLTRYEEALVAYEQAIKLDPNYALAYYNKGLTLHAMKRNNEATICFGKAKQLGFLG